MLAEGEVLQGGGDLVDLLHSRTGRAAADEHDDITMRDSASLDRIDGGSLGHEDLRRSNMAIDIVFVDQRGIYRCAFNYASFRCEISYREADGCRETARSCSVR